MKLFCDHRLPCPSEFCDGGRVEMSGPQFFDGDYEVWMVECPDCDGSGFMLACDVDMGECPACDAMDEAIGAGALQ